MRAPGDRDLAPRDSARVRSLRAARARAPGGSRAAARLHAFMQRRGLTDPRPGVASVAVAPHLERLSRGRAAASRADAYQQALAAPIRRPAARRGAGAPEWRCLGPTSIPHGQTYGNGAGASPPVAGRVAAIAVDPSNPRHLLVGSAGGGVWESRNRGRSWIARTDHQLSLGIGALAFDPANPKRVYAGTGEGNSLEVPGQGLLRSLDGGTTWSITAEATFAGAFFFRLAVSDQLIIAATDRGVYRSIDAGRTWTRVRRALTWDVSMRRDAVGGIDIVEVLAACEDGLFQSMDSGRSWTRVALPGGPASFAGVVGRMAVAHAPSNDAIAYVFAARKTSVWFWASDATTGKFAKVPLKSLDPPGGGDPGNGIMQCWYDWCLAVDPADADCVFIGAIELFRGRRSSTGKWSWSDLSSKKRGDSIHPDQHTIVVDPARPGVVYVGNDGGIFRSPDRGDSWQSLNPGLGITEFEYIAQHPRQRTWILGGTQDNGTLRNRGRVWEQVAPGDGGDCAVNSSAPDTCYHSYYGMATERSRSGGGRWYDITPPVPDTYNALFYPPLEVNGKTVARAGESVWISDDEGHSWSEIPLPAGDVASAMTFDGDNRLVVGRADGEIYRLDRSPNGWGPAQHLVSLGAAYVSDLSAHPSAPGRYWATVSTLGAAHVYLSQDSGATWDDVSANLPDAPANAIAIDPQRPSTVWVATDVGVFRSTNRARSWSRFGVGLPRALAVDLALHERLRLLRVGTRSRGVWEIAIG